jgi:hypothetical protein
MATSSLTLSQVTSGVGGGTIRPRGDDVSDDSATTAMGAAMRDAYARLDPEAREQLLARTVATANDTTTAAAADNGADDVEST